jgi:hypothetical protein
MNIKAIRKRRIVTSLAILASTVLLSACGGGGGGSGGGEAGTGSFTLGITDAPVDDATNVSMMFTGVEIQRKSGEWLVFDFNAPKTIDLLALHGGGSENLLHISLPIDCYKGIKLKISADPQAHRFEEKTGGMRYMHLEPGHEDGLHMYHEFCMAKGSAMDYTIHFDLRKSVHCPMGGGDCTLMPALHLVDNATACRISGIVDSSHMSMHNHSCSGGDVVYIFEGHDVTPCDVCEGDACAGAPCSASPITTAMVNLDPGTGDYVYTAAFLRPGNYTMAFTCHAYADHPDTHETIQFMGHANESCSVEGHKHHHFPR